VNWSVVKWSVGFTNRVSIIISRYIGHMKYADNKAFFVYHILSYSFGSTLYQCIYGCIFL
jgi:hypothetical protein